MNSPTRRAFLCSGQGARPRTQDGKGGLSNALFAHVPDLLALAHSFSTAAGRDVPALLTTTLNPADTLSAHVALTAHSLLAWEALDRTTEDRERDSYLLAGHSLGEIAALSCAGALSPEDALRLAVVRGTAMGKACTGHKGQTNAEQGAMLAVMAPKKSAAPSMPPQDSFLNDLAVNDLGAQDLIQETAQTQGVWIANHNSPTQVVLSGARAALEACVSKLEKTGLRCVMLPTAGAFHTLHMAGVAEAVLDFAQRLEWRPLTALCLSSLTGRALHQSPGTGFAAHLALQVVRPVQWLEVMRAMRRAGVTEITESGADGTLTRLCQSLPGWNVCPVPLSQKLENMTLQEIA